jgi:hypothetical protein
LLKDLRFIRTLTATGEIGQTAKCNERHSVNVGQGSRMRTYRLGRSRAAKTGHRHRRFEDHA